MKRRLIPAAALLALVGCDDPPKSEQRIPAYANFDACVAATKEDGSKTHTPSECHEAFRTAAEAHAKTAPKYSSRDACETSGHSCYAHRDHNGSDVFMPLLAGFMIGNMLANGQRQSMPVYVDRDNNAYSGGNRVGAWRDCRATNSCGGGGSTFLGSTGSSSSSVWSSGAYRSTTHAAPATPSWGSKPTAIAPSATARGGFGGSASAAATSSGG